LRKRESSCVIQGSITSAFNSCGSGWKILDGVSQKCITFCFHAFKFRLGPPFIFWTHLAKCDVRANVPTVTPLLLTFHFRFMFDMPVGSYWLISWQCLITVNVPWILRNPWFKQIFLDRVWSFVHNFTLCKLLNTVVFLRPWIDSRWFRFALWIRASWYSAMVLASEQA
jgi:hypothetical protein